MGYEAKLQGSNFEPFMSALGQKRTLTRSLQMFALPPKADIGRACKILSALPPEFDPCDTDDHELIQIKEP